MEKRQKAELVSQGMTNLMAEYSKDYREPGIHVSDLIYCLTKSWFDKLQPLPPTPQEVLLFALGLGLQKVLVPYELGIKPIIRDGVICSPDYMSRDGAAELKTTRMSASKEDLPETWMEQIMAYCYVTYQTKYDLLVLHMMGNYKPPFPSLAGWELEFSEEELSGHWDYLMGRKVVLESALTSNQPPMPFKYCKEWECKSCRYRLRCDVLSLVGKER